MNIRANLWDPWFPISGIGYAGFKTRRFAAEGGELRLAELQMRPLQRPFPAE